MKYFLRILFLLAITPIVSGHEGDLYVVDVGPNRGPPWQVLKYDENGQNPEVFIDAELNRPQDIVFLEHENSALVSSLGSGRITRHNATTGDFVDDFASGIGQPTRMEIGDDNLLYVLQWGGNGRVWRYDLAGNFVDEFTTTGVTNSIGLDWDSQGNLYVASFDGRHVRKFDANGNDLGLFVTSGLQGPTNIWFDEQGDLLVVDWSGRAIRRYDSSGVLQGDFVTGLNEPEGIEFLDNGDFLVGNGGTSSVRQYDANGDFVGDFIPGGLGGLAKPNALRFRKLSDFRINAGLNDSWFNQATSGQGFFIVVFPDRQEIFLAWFTYDTVRPPEDISAFLGEPGHRWLTAQGPYDGDTATLNVFLTQGGVFDSAEPSPETGESIGTISVIWHDCENATLSYDIDPPGVTGVIELRRITPDNVSLCETLGN